MHTPRLLCPSRRDAGPYPRDGRATRHSSQHEATCASPSRSAVLPACLCPVARERWRGASLESLVLAIPRGEVFRRHGHEAVDFCPVGGFRAVAIRAGALLLLLLLRELVRLHQSSQMGGCSRAEDLGADSRIAGVELGGPRQFLGREAGQQFGAVAGFLGRPGRGRLLKRRVMPSHFLLLALQPLLPPDLLIMLLLRAGLHLLLKVHLLHLELGHHLFPPRRFGEVVGTRCIHARVHGAIDTRASAVGLSARGASRRLHCGSLAADACPYSAPRVLHRLHRCWRSLRLPPPWPTFGGLGPSGAPGCSRWRLHTIAAGRALPASPPLGVALAITCSGHVTRLVVGDVVTCRPSSRRVPLGGVAEDLLDVPNGVGDLLKPLPNCLITTTEPSDDGAQCGTDVTAQALNGHARCALRSLARVQGPFTLKGGHRLSFAFGSGCIDLQPFAELALAAGGLRQVGVQFALMEALLCLSFA